MDRTRPVHVDTDSQGVPLAAGTTRPVGAGLATAAAPSDPDPLGNGDDDGPGLEPPQEPTFELTELLAP